MGRIETPLFLRFFPYTSEEKIKIFGHSFVYCTKCMENHAKVLSRKRREQNVNNRVNNRWFSEDSLRISLGMVCEALWIVKMSAKTLI